MGTDTASSDEAADAAGHAETDMAPLTAREDSKAVLRKRSVMPPPLDRVMKEVAPDPANDAGGAARMERRLGILEKAFADIVERHEKSLRERAGALAAVEESVLAVRNRLEQSENHHAGTLMDLRAALAEASMRLNGLEAGQSSGAESTRPSLETEPVSVRPTPDMTGVWSSELSTLPVPGHAEAVPQKESRPLAATSERESYISAARRAANASMTQHEETGARAGGQKPRGLGRARLLLFGCAAPMVILATAVILINRHSVTASPVPASAFLAPQAEAQMADSQSVDPPVPTALSPPELLASPPSDPTPAQTASAAPFGELQERARAGDAAAERDLGLKHLAGDGLAVNEAEAARWLLSAAYKGEPTAEYWLGTLYARGHGVPADAGQANHWYEASAKQGNRRAMHSFAVANFQGQGMDKNYPEAARWFQRAAELGFVDSQFNLGVLYERGAGVPQSLSEAYKWYAIAAAQGDKEAALRVAALAKELKPADLAAARAAAASFKPAPLDEAANAANGQTQSSGG